MAFAIRKNYVYPTTGQPFFVHSLRAGSKRIHSPQPSSLPSNPPAGCQACLLSCGRCNQPETRHARRLALAVAVLTESAQGLLLLHTVQPAGKRSMEIRTFINGAPDFIGSQLGNEIGK